MKIIYCGFKTDFYQYRVTFIKEQKGSIYKRNKKK